MDVNVTLERFSVTYGGFKLRISCSGVSIGGEVTGRCCVATALGWWVCLALGCVLALGIGDIVVVRGSGLWVVPREVLDVFSGGGFVVGGVLGDDPRELGELGVLCCLGLCFRPLAKLIENFFGVGVGCGGIFWADPRELKGVSMVSGVLVPRFNMEVFFELCWEKEIRGNG